MESVNYANADVQTAALDQTKAYSFLYREIARRVEPILEMARNLAK